MQNVFVARHIALAKLQPDRKDKFLRVRIYTPYEAASLYYVLGRLLGEFVAQSKNVHRPEMLQTTVGAGRIQETHQTISLNGGRRA